MNKRMLSKVVVVSLCLALLIFAGSGCKRKGQELDTGFDTTSTTGMERTTGEGLPDLDLERLLFDQNSDSGLKPIYFDFDSSGLRPDALITLRENAEKIKQVPGVYVQIAGHCDERGTQEYNLALGERRALAVRNHLIQLGVSGDRLVTISYGKEFPAVLGSNEAAWAKNRRAEFNRAQ